MRKLNVRIKRDPSYFKPKNYKHYLTLTELAVEVGKDPSWIRRLEARGDLPEPVRVQRGELRIRLYSPENVREIKQVLKTIKPGRKPTKPAPPKPYGV